MLHQDKTLKLISLILLPAALAVKAFAAPHTIAHQVSDYLLGLGAAFGVYSTTGRAPK